MIEVLYTPNRKGRKEPPIKEVSKERWTEIKEKFPPTAGYRMANLAAHSWTILFRNESELIAVCPWSAAGECYRLNGDQFELTDEEIDEFFPRIPKGQERGWPIDTEFYSRRDNVRYRRRYLLDKKFLETE